MKPAPTCCVKCFIWRRKCWRAGFSSETGACSRAVVSLLCMSPSLIVHIPTSVKGEGWHVQRIIGRCDHWIILLVYGWDVTAVPLLTPTTWISRQVWLCRSHVPVQVQQVEHAAHSRVLHRSVLNVIQLIQDEQKLWLSGWFKVPKHVWFRVTVGRMYTMNASRKELWLSKNACKCPLREGCYG